MTAVQERSGGRTGQAAPAVAAYARSFAALSSLSMLFTLMLSFNTGFAPIDSYPGALRPWSALSR